jgi:NADPH-dependent F420 reductase
MVRPGLAFLLQPSFVCCGRCRAAGWPRQENFVKIAGLGAGRVGAVLGSRWARSGHSIVYGSRDPSAAHVVEAVQRAGDKSAACHAAEAVAQGDVVVIATPYRATLKLLPKLGDLSGKILVDCTNPVRNDMSGLELGHDSSAAERIADLAPSARVVKAFNCVSTRTMADPTYDGQSAPLFYCGDDAAAKQVVRGLAEELGFEAIDAGPLEISRYLEPLAMFYIQLAMTQGWGGDCALGVMRRLTG